MAEAVVSIVVEIFLGELVSRVLKEVLLPFGVREQLTQLKEKLSDIQAVLSDAEEQQEKNAVIKNCLRKLKDVVYDAEDLLDEIATEDLRRRVEVGGSMTKKVFNFFSSSNPLAISNKIGHEIKNIMERIDEIAVSMRSFQFMPRPVGRGVEHNDRETHSFEHSKNVIGRDHERDMIVEYLVSSSEQNVTVVAIVGIAGLGKTTLARMVYNDDKVARHFNLMMWARVPENFELKTIMKKILKSAIKADCGDLEMDQLQESLRENLKDKRFLLVLDDVWHDKKDKWDSLKVLLTSNVMGSKILVTTRNETVSSAMNASTTYNLPGLSGSDCWSLFKKCAFKEGEDKKHPKLEQIGRQIVQNCVGVPLAVRTLGGMLYAKIDERDWLYVQNNEICKLPFEENDILPELTLSYNHMLPYLKQCFAYCSLFPKDHLIYREHLIQLWMAQGFIQLPAFDRNHQLEDIGNIYFNQLLSRCFFRGVDEAFDSNIRTCKMHDLVLHLAKWVGETECSLVNVDSINFSKEVRHVSYLESKFSIRDFAGYLPSSVKSLRTLFFPLLEGTIGESDLDNIISKFKYLRVLDLSGSNIEKLPSSICKLKHLRFLDLSRNGSIKTLSNSICKLHNLQTLKLFGCELLEELPIGIGKLINLRHLEVTSRQNRLTGNLTSGLTSLQSLIVGSCDYLISLSEGMQHLTSLRTLRILNCKRLVSLSDTMQHLITLENLVILDCPNLCLTQNDMKGIKSLRSLDIGRIPMLKSLPQGGLPQGLQQVASMLQYLSIAFCHNLTALPEWLEELTLLKRLEIVDCPNLKTLPKGIRFLNALQVLVIVKCPDLGGRCRKDSGKDWHNIAHVPQIIIK